MSGNPFTIYGIMTDDNQLRLNLPNGDMMVTLEEVQRFARSVLKPGIYERGHITICEFKMTPITKIERVIEMKEIDLTKEED